MILTYRDILHSKFIA